MNEPQVKPQPADVSPYQFFMLTLCAWALVNLAAGTFLRIEGSTRTNLDYADNLICGFFLVDFVTRSRRRAGSSSSS